MHELIKTARVEAGLTQEQLAEMTGVTQVQYVGGKQTTQQKE
ncbi:helix-turn-helix domain-containing protein [Zooshikella ganghwensis]|nr:helix-turn-helix transcriptional regulator [Zooshikella ganghwensis]